MMFVKVIDYNNVQIVFAYQVKRMRFSVNAECTRVGESMVARNNSGLVCGELRSFLQTDKSNGTSRIRDNQREKHTKQFILQGLSGGVVLRSD